MADYESELLNPKALASDAEQVVPDKNGYYSIHLTTPEGLEDWVTNHIADHNIIYVSIATNSLYRRLTRQELRHKSPATFFRRLGAVLGYRPPPGSLVGKANQRNYRFTNNDTQSIIAWINENLAISWFVDKMPSQTVERDLIGKLRLMTNIAGNPAPLPGLSELRSEFRAIACAEQRS
ncbi:MAG: GIY-YIG nuclease family protein [bacterium]